MKTKRLITWLLILAMLVTSFALTSCKGDDDDDDDDDLEVPEEQLSPAFDGEAKRYSGNFTVVTETDRNKGQAFNIVDLVEADNLGDSTIIKAVTERNNLIKSNFGVTIKRRQEANLGTFVTNAIESEEVAYDAFMVGVQSGLTIACKGGVLDLDVDTQYLDLSGDWWDQGIKENLLLARGSYIAVGDLLTVDKDATWCVLFNKANLSSKNKGVNETVLYNLVTSGDGVKGGWTIDKLVEYAKQHYTEENNTDTNGQIYNPGYTGNGMYGYYTQKETATVLLQSGGFTPTLVDTTELCGVVDNLNNNKQFDEAIIKVKSVFGDVVDQPWFLDLNTVCDGAAAGEDRWQTHARGSFSNNRATFFMCHIGTIDLLSDMQSDFGVLPIPKLYEDQLDYANTIQYGNAHCYIIPDRNKEALNEKSGYILEAMAYYSSQEFADTESLNYAYYYKVLRGKGTRDDASWAMLDLIFDNRVYDLACALNIANVNSVIQGAVCKAEGNWTSSKQASLGALQSKIADQLEILTMGE